MRRTLLIAGAFACACTAATAADEPKFCLKDQQNSFCILSDSEVQFVPYREVENTYHVSIPVEAMTPENREHRKPPAR